MSTETVEGISTGNSSPGERPHLHRARLGALEPECGDRGDRPEDVDRAPTRSTDPCRAAGRRRRRRGTPGSGGRSPDPATGTTSARTAGGRCRRGRSRASRSGRRGRARCRVRRRHAGPRHPPSRAVRSDDSRSTPIGFSVHTCLPAAMIASETSTCTAGIVRLTTISMSGSPSTDVDAARRSARRTSRPARGRGPRAGRRSRAPARRGTS